MTFERKVSEAAAEEAAHEFSGTLGGSVPVDVVIERGKVLRVVVLDEGFEWTDTAVMESPDGTTDLVGQVEWPAWEFGY